MKLETSVIEIIEGKRTAPLSKMLLAILSRGMGAFVSIRNKRYDLGGGKQMLPIPVISVGSIVAGGTGKTPFVRYLAEKMEEKVAILSRGYRRSGKSIVHVDDQTSPSECGDEPYWLSRKLPKADVIVGSDRVETGKIAVEKGAEVVLLDDGMQHRRLERDLEIAVLHATDLFGKGYFLPRGFLRDSVKRLADVDLIVVTGLESLREREGFEKKLQKYGNAPVMGCSLEVENGAEIASKKVAFFSAIAKTERFHQTLKSLGCEIVEQISKPDHFTFGGDELETLANRAYNQGAELLVCTEKDEVKLAKKLALRLPVKALKTKLVPLFGEEHLDKLVKEVIHGK